MDLIEQLSTTAPVPAGGAAATYSACLGVGLLNKTVILEIGRRAAQPEIEKNLVKVRKKIERLREDLRRLVDEDGAAYLVYAKSLQGSDSGEKKNRFSDVMAVSMQVIEKCTHGLEWARQLNTLVPEALRTHLLAACELLWGAIQASLHVARGNLRQVVSESRRSSYLKQLIALREECRIKYQSVLGMIEGEG